MDQAVCNNRVTIIGRMQGVLEYSHSLYGEAFYTFKLAAPRLSSAVDVLPITISERLLAACMVKDGDCLLVNGQLRSYNKCVDGVNRLILTIFAHSLERVQTIRPHNEICISGYICKPPIYRTTPFNREICDLLVAVNRAYNRSDYIPCITWGRNARFAQTLTVGGNVSICGRVQSREYNKSLESGESVVRVAYEVSVAHFETLT